MARDFLEPVKKQFLWISYADLYTLAGVTAIEEMGGVPPPASVLVSHLIFVSLNLGELGRMCLELT